MILYHGSNTDFGTIDLLKSKPNKDFRRGFYLTEEPTDEQLKQLMHEASKIIHHEILFPMKDGVMFKQYEEVLPHWTASIID